MSHLIFHEICQNVIDGEIVGKIKIIIFLLLLYFVASPIFAARQVLHYEPKVVTISGILRLKTFPGPPNYESIEGGDDLEPCLCLLLDHAIDVVKSATDTDQDAETENNVKAVQVGIPEKPPWDDKYLNKHVRIIGTLFHHFWGHHHTRVLIDSSRFELVQPEFRQNSKHGKHAKINTH